MLGKWTFFGVPLIVDPRLPREAWHFGHLDSQGWPALVVDDWSKLGRFCNVDVSDQPSASIDDLLYFWDQFCGRRDVGGWPTSDHAREEC